MRKGSISIIKMLLAVIILFFSFGMTCQAEEVYRNPDTGYTVVVEDDGSLLSGVKRTELIEVMKEISTYGNLQEQRISQPLKIVSGVLFGLFLGCLLTYARVTRWYKKHLPQPEAKEELFMSDIRFVNVRMTGETKEKTYYPLGTIYRAYPKEVDNLFYGKHVPFNKKFFWR